MKAVVIFILFLCGELLAGTKTLLFYNDQNKLKEPEICLAPKELSKEIPKGKSIYTWTVVELLKGTNKKDQKKGYTDPFRKLVYQGKSKRKKKNCENILSTVRRQPKMVSILEMGKK